MPHSSKCIVRRRCGADDIGLCVCRHLGASDIVRSTSQPRASRLLALQPIAVSLLYTMPCGCRGPATQYIHRCNHYSPIAPAYQASTMMTCRDHDLWMQATISHQTGYDAHEQAVSRNHQAQEWHRDHQTQGSYDGSQAAQGVLETREDTLTAARSAAAIVHDVAIRAGCARARGNRLDAAEPLRIAGLCPSCGDTSQGHAR